MAPVIASTGRLQITYPDTCDCNVYTPFGGTKILIGSKYYGEQIAKKRSLTFAIREWPNKIVRAPVHVERDMMSVRPVALQA